MKIEYLLNEMICYTTLLNLAMKTFINDSNVFHYIDWKWWLDILHEDEKTSFLIYLVPFSNSIKDPNFNQTLLSKTSAQKIIFFPKRFYIFTAAQKITQKCVLPHKCFEGGLLSLIFTWERERERERETGNVWKTR